jgi:hypothetical protein
MLEQLTLPVARTQTLIESVLKCCGLINIRQIDFYYFSSLRRLSFCCTVIIILCLAAGGTAKKNKSPALK